MKRIYLFLVKHKDIIGICASLVIIMTFVIGGVKLMFKPPALKLKVRAQQYHYPNEYIGLVNNVSDYLENLHEYNISRKSYKHDLDSLTISWGMMLYFVRDTRQFWEFTITNTTGRSIHNVHVRIPAVNKLVDYNIDGSMFLQAEKESIYVIAGYDDKNRMFFIDEIKSIPPHATLVIRLWGEKTSSYLEPDISVYSDEGAGIIVKSHEVEGVKAFVATNLEPLLIMLILLISIIFMSQKTAKGKQRSKK
ncbi:hypothetical protein ES705_21453 [subsurface metagenome]